MMLFMTWSFRRLTRADFPLVASWLSQPEVARWWQHAWTAQAMERDFGPSVDGLEPNEDWLALLGGDPVGLVQRSLVSDYAENVVDFAALGPVPDGALTIDYLLGEGRGQGRGAAMIAAFVAQCWADHPVAPAVVVSVVEANRASWRCLERAGFRVVGRGECPPENPADDPLHLLLLIDRPTRAHVLVEGPSDVAAVRAVASVLGVDLTGVELVSLGGVTNIRRALVERYAAGSPPLVLGLCDAGETAFVERALRAVGHPVRDATDLPSYGFFTCHRDLEDELLRALGARRAREVIADLGLTAKLDTLLQQPQWAGRESLDVLHRFCGVASGRKELLAGALAGALAPEEVPEPVRLLVERLAHAARPLGN
jgi:aminoglycoside 6'-N-acetyltransferase